MREVEQQSVNSLHTALMGTGGTPGAAHRYAEVQNRTDERNLAQNNSEDEDFLALGIGESNDAGGLAARLQELDSDGSADVTVKKKRVKNSSLGLLFIAIIVIIWVAASFLVQDLEGKLNAPFFLTYIATNTFSVLLPIGFLSGSFSRVINNDAAIALGQGDPTRYSLKQIFRGACIICPFWFLANYLYNFGLHYTSVTSSTILSSMSVVFTLGLGSFMRLEKVTWRKTIGVAACVWGTILVGLQDHNAASAPNSEMSKSAGTILLGDLATLLGAFFYACYTLLIEKLFPGGDSSVDMALVFGFIGIVNCIFLSPLVVIFHFTGFESLSALTWAVFSGLLLNGLFNNVCSDYLFARAVLLTTPTITSIGLAMTIPLATVIESIVKGSLPPWMTICGAILVTAGFITASLSRDQ